MAPAQGSLCSDSASTEPASPVSPSTPMAARAPPFPLLPSSPTEAAAPSLPAADLPQEELDLSQPLPPTAHPSEPAPTAPTVPLQVNTDLNQTPQYFTFNSPPQPFAFYRFGDNIYQIPIATVPEGLYTAPAANLTTDFSQGSYPSSTNSSPPPFASNHTALNADAPIYTPPYTPPMPNQPYSQAYSYSNQHPVAQVLSPPVTNYSPVPQTYSPAPETYPPAAQFHSPPSSTYSPDYSHEESTRDEYPEEHGSRSRVPMYRPPVGNPTKHSTDLTTLWHGGLEENMAAYTQHEWSLQPLVGRQTAPHGCTEFKDTAKIRFRCEECDNGWTSMHGKVHFYFYLDAAAGSGHVYFRLFPQLCRVCVQRKGAAAREQSPLWYADEVIKVVQNLSVKLATTYYNLQNPVIQDKRRLGRPRGQHDARLCVACRDGLCRRRALER